MATRLLVPNFFLAGAPKCGTTALSEYLGSHPNVFLSYPKEPGYFADDLPHVRAVESLDDYLALFAKRGKAHRVVGEATVWYLYSKTAMRRVHDFNGDGKIILMFRNPVDLLQSLHADFLFSFYEDRENFQDAWELQDVRRKGAHIPGRCRTPEFLQYREIAMFGDQFERLLAVFPREQIKCVFYDDLIDDPGMVYRDVLAFLGLPDDGRADFSRVNPSKTHRSARLGALLMHPPWLLRAPWSILKRTFGLGLSRISQGLIRANSTPRDRPPISPDFQARLQREFAADVAKLSRLTGRDLSFWTEAGDCYKPSP